jgi:GTP-binding protein
LLPQSQPEEDEEDDIIHIAVVGKPNVGKSSLVNMLLREERSIVSDIPGTTRDAIDTAFELDGQKYVIIDTAGMRRKAKIEYDSVERFSVVRTLIAVRRADVVLIMLDARDEVTDQDTKIAGFVHEEGKASIIVLNKWDLVDKQEITMDQVRDRIQNQLPFMSYAPAAFISAKTGQRVNRLLETVRNVNEQYGKRITTGTLNDVLTDAIRINEPPLQSGRKAKILYGTQVSAKPPTFVLFVNDPQRMHYSYLRYLENQFRKAFGFEGTPLRIQMRARNEKEE